MHRRLRNALLHLEPAGTALSHATPNGWLTNCRQEGTANPQAGPIVLAIKAKGACHPRTTGWARVEDEFGNESEEVSGDTASFSRSQMAGLVIQQTRWQGLKVNGEPAVPVHLPEIIGGVAGGRNHPRKFLVLKQQRVQWKMERFSRWVISKV